MRLSGLSQIITADSVRKSKPGVYAVGNDTGFEPWMWVNVLADLEKGDFDHKSLQYLQTANRLLTRAHKVDSARIVGYVAGERQHDQLVTSLRDSLSRTDEMRIYWYKNTSGPRPNGGAGGVWMPCCCIYA